MSKYFDEYMYLTSAIKLPPVEPLELLGSRTMFPQLVKWIGSNKQCHFSRL